MIFNMVLVIWSSNVFGEGPIIKMNDLLITSDYKFGFYGGFVYKNDFNFFFCKKARYFYHDLIGIKFSKFSNYLHF